jgi:EAL domain-containing protein (putative c-di-GMP-specific phosphodiesterase class I)
MRVVAEGIEHEEQHDALLALGCELGQGYLFAAPLPLERLRELLDDQRSRVAP